MKKTAYVTAFFYLEEDELNNAEFDQVKEQFREIVNNSYYQLYNENNQIAYGSDYGKIDPVILDSIRSKGALSFSNDDFFCYGLAYHDNQGNFVIVSREKKDAAFSQFRILFYILLFGLLAGIMLVIILNKIIARIAYRPFRKVIKEVNKISTENIDVQIPVAGTHDELDDLIITFNSLLEKVAKSFIIQRNFVRYVSHEFKTPLASMMGNLEVFSLKDRSAEEYRMLANKLIGQISDMENILSTLIAISDLRNKTQISTSTRIDELIWEIIEKIKLRYAKSIIHVRINISPDKSNLMYVDYDRAQLLIALYNLIENAVKYSRGKDVEITIFEKNNLLNAEIKDQGIGIPENELCHISKPFYRADNTNKISGSGIGLSIALQIFENNGIPYSIHSIQDSGTTIHFELPA
ncbi:MAG: HAMP domain-containing sensor histidine kinase [Bacteroidales bacterium]